MTTTTEVRVKLRTPHGAQARFVYSKAKRKVIRAGRRSGKTTGVGIVAVEYFLAGKRVLYGAPTNDQVERFWSEVKRSMAEALDARLFYRNETRHIIELPGTEQRIRAKTAWNADSLRGDYADLLILDEWQLMNEEAWELVGAPMLLDNNGDAIFIYTPPSLRSRSASKARDPRHAAKLFAAAELETSGRWEVFHFTSADNPHISREALDEITSDMTALAYRQEIMAEDVDKVPGALWEPDVFTYAEPPEEGLTRVEVGVDPAGGSGGDEVGIIIAGERDRQGWVLGDWSGHYSSDVWARKVVAAYHEFQADRVVVEKNFGGDMVKSVIRTVDRTIPIKEVTASRGKAVRAEPVAALYEQGKVHHAHPFRELQDQLCTWTPEGRVSPDRMDALVWVLSDLMVNRGRPNVRWLE